MFKKEFFTKNISLVGIFAFWGIFCFVNSSAMAEGFKPTLDSLAGKPIVGTDPVEYYPQDLKSGYTVTEITNVDPDNLPANTITVYDVNEETKAITPMYYEVNLIQTGYGHKDSYDSIKYFKYTTDTNGNNILTTGSESDYDVEYYIDGTRNGERITTNQNGNDIDKDFFYKNTERAIYNSNGAIGDITGDFIGNKIDKMHGAAIYNNGTINNITGDFIGNHIISTYGTVYGGAIYNKIGTIGNITGNFIGNYANSRQVAAYGGVIYNDGGTTGDISGNFIGNYTVNSSNYTTDSSNGGVIYNFNYGKIGSIIGDFVGNYSHSYKGEAMGGAIYNYNSSTIGDITGDFIGNYTSVNNSNAYGGAIYNKKSIIGNITSDFIGNYVNSKNNSGNTIGGAIVNTGGSIIGNITGNFITNYTSSTSSNSGYGAVYNATKSTIGNITGDFICNYTNGPFVGAIGNSGKIGDIFGDFIENHSGNNYDGYAGAISNTGTIGNISGDFINNYTYGAYRYAYGGAIYSQLGSIGDINGNFIGNYASGGKDTFGGAIYNYGGTYSNITGGFIGNYALSKTKANGGAIYNTGKIANIINSSFYNNYAKATNGTAQGGAIWTNKDMTITADNGQSIFSGNYTESKGVKDGNAIWVNSSSAKLNLTAQNNGLIKFDDNINGTSGYTVNMSGDKTGTISLYNDVKNAKVVAQNVTVDFANNEAKNYNFVSLTDNGNTKYNIDLDLATGQADKITTANASSGTITLNILNFINTQANPDEPFTFQILNTQNDNLQLAFGDNIKILGDVNPNNIAESIYNKVGNTIYNDEIYMSEDGIVLGTTNTKNDSITVQKSKIFDTLDLIATKDTTEEKNFIFRTADKYIVAEDLGAVKGSKLNIIGLGESTPSQIDANAHSLFKLDNNTKLNISNIVISNASAQQGSVINAINSDADITLENVSLTNNSASQKGGAIFSNANINISANNAKVEYTGNKDSAGSNVIYLNNSLKAINVDAKNNASIAFNDSINGEVGYDLNLTTDEKSSIVINNNIKNADININSNNIDIGSLEYLNNNNNSLSINGANFALANLGSTQLHFRNFANTGNVSISNVNVDLINRSMGRIYADSYGDTSGIIDVQNLTLLNDAVNNSTSVLFADSGIANSVKYTGSNTIAYSPIYTYNVHYSQNPEDNLGYFVFTRGSGSSNPSDNFNPAVLPTAVTQQSGAYTTQMQTFHYAFQHAENFMNIPALDRLVIKNQNKYALSPTTDATDVGRLSPLFDKSHEHNGFWVKPYSSFESVPLKNGPKVSNINYGTLIGYDSAIKELKYGWDRVLTGYIGYNGASQRYKGVDTYQNGGILGSTITLYKGNFFNATTLSVGSSVGSTTSSFGHEDYTMLLGGIGNKTGYNFEFKDGRFIFQPSMLISYTFVNTFDYTNAAGVRIDSDPLHAIQLAPGVKFIMNTKNGWQPYMAVNMVWNALDKQKVMANDVRLPEMSIKPYVEYGMGIQRCFKNDSVTAFGQTMVRNGGRNGVSLTAGLRFKVGKDSSHNDKVKAEKIEKVKKENKKQASSIKKEHNKVPKVSKMITAPHVKLFGWSL